MPQFFALLGSLTVGRDGLVWLPPFPLCALGLLVIEHAIWASRFRPVMMMQSDRWYSPWLVGFGLAALALFAPSQTQPFVYFQF